MFDQLHACGLATFLNCLTEGNVKLLDVGVAYQIKASDVPGCLPEDLWERLFPIPENDDLDNASELSLSVFDGLLALLFTSPGARFVSTEDAKWQAKYKSMEIAKGLVKVRKAIERWKRFVSRQDKKGEDLLTNLRRCYSTEEVPDFLPMHKKENDLSIPMTLDPTFSFATRQSVSDHNVSKKRNVTFVGVRYAPFLAYIGASRWLRAQRVGGDLVNFYVPMFRELDVDCKTSMPMLRGNPNGSQQVLLYEWLTAFLKGPFLLKGLAYQVLQTQGAQQSISIGRGCLGYQWLHQLQDASENAVLHNWRFLLSPKKEKSPLDLDLLQEAIMNPYQFSTWKRHLSNHALSISTNKGKQIRRYSLETIQEVVKNMSPNSPMSTIIARKNGTLRFGHALRQLGRHNSAEWHDTITELQSVRSQTQLLQTLAKANQACLVAKAKSDFIVVPNDMDAAILLDDIATFGPEEIASLLIILSTLQYAFKEIEEMATNEVEPTTNRGESVHEQSK